MASDIQKILVELRDNKTFRSFNVGKCKLTIRYVADEKSLYLSGVRLESKYRGTGEATKALTELMQALDALHEKIRLEVQPMDKKTNFEGLVRLYSRFGFKKIRDPKAPAYYIMERKPHKLHKQRESNTVKGTAMPAKIYSKTLDTALKSMAEKTGTKLRQTVTSTGKFLLKTLDGRDWSAPCTEAQAVKQVKMYTQGYQSAFAGSSRIFAFSRKLAIAGVKHVVVSATSFPALATWHRYHNGDLNVTVVPGFEIKIERADKDVSKYWVSVYVSSGLPELRSKLSFSNGVVLQPTKSTYDICPPREISKPLISKTEEAAYAIAKKFYVWLNGTASR